MATNIGTRRTRSIRNIPPKENADPVVLEKARPETRNPSPSRAPMRPPARSGIPSATTSTSTTTSRLRGKTIPTRQNSLLSTKPSLKSPDASTSSIAKPVTRAASVRQAPSTTPTGIPSTRKRSVSGTRPKSSDDSHPVTATKVPTIGHSRSKSTITSLNAATTLRPLSINAPSRSSNPSPAPSTNSTTSNTTISKPGRTSSPQSNSSTTVSAAPATTMGPPPAPTRRPAFNTNQQHYTPAKPLAPKPLTSTFLAPPTPSKQPANIALSAETSRLQTELLQLSLLHRDAHKTAESWHDSAKSKLQSRFESVAAADAALQRTERESSEERAIRELRRWGREDPGLEERVRLLDGVLNGVWALGEPGGRFQRVVDAFEEWVERVAEIRAAQDGGDVEALLACGDSFGRGRRRSISAPERGAGIFVGDLDAGSWKRDRAGLVRLLEGWKGDLVVLGVGEEPETPKKKGADDESDEKPEPIKPPSGLSRALSGCRALVHDMLAELEMMEVIERDALLAEEEWMEAVETQMLAAEDDALQKQQVRGFNEEVLPWKMLVF